jgi:adenylate cyclase
MTTRRLAAILAADVVGFSSMMEKDEEGTLAQIKSLQREVIEPKVRDHHGRLVKTTGDGILVEYASPVEAVRCALAVQEALSTSSVQLRIGINFGDVIFEEDGDVYGDGVNIAARLEQLAEPGGVCISGKVYDEVEGKVDGRFQGGESSRSRTSPSRCGCTHSRGKPLPIPVAKHLPLPNKPSLAVLPFTNMSGDPEQEYFADGVVEDIITAL